MTITDNGRVAIDQLMPQAREEWAKGLRSKEGFRKVLRVSWDRAVEVHSRLSSEAAEKERRKREERRSALIKMRGQKRSGRVLPVRHRPLPEVPAATTAVDAAQPTVVVPLGGAEEALAVSAGAVVSSPGGRRSIRRWPLLLLALPAFVAIWSGWVGLGGITGFGVVHPLPGIADQVSINTAITLPIGLETYAAYALYAWLSGGLPLKARQFAKWSAIGSLALGAGGQITYHLLVSTGPWLITTIVACLPVLVLGLGAALYHLVNAEEVTQ